MFMERDKIHEIIFGAETPAGKLFDIVLLWAILLSVLVVSLESVESLSVRYKLVFNLVEWVLTILFTIEYALRLYAVRSARRYALSFFGIVDLLSIVPAYLQLFFVTSHFFLIVRSLRLLRVFRILKLARYLSAADDLSRALHASRQKIIVFMIGVSIIALLAGTLMYMVEGAQAGFTSIPRGVYWAVVTLTKVGYGDIYPITPLGQSLSALLMVLGYGIIAVPTGIVTAEIALLSRASSNKSCSSCLKEINYSDALYCKYCSSEL